MNRDGYSHPKGPNIQIYHEGRDRGPWAEQSEIQRFDTTPCAKAEQTREILAFRELGW